MKRFICFSLAWKLVLIFSADLYGQDRERENVTVEVNYLGGELKTQFDYPKADRPFTASGKRHDTNGLQVGAVVVVNGLVSIGGRVEESFLRRTRFFDQDRFGKRSDPDTNLKSSGASYQEAYTSIVLPKTAGHHLIVGVARTAFSQEWEFTVYPSPPPPSVGGSDLPIQEFPPFRINSQLDITAIGPMVGIEGGKSMGRLRLNWSGRIYPRMARTDRNSSAFEFGLEKEYDSKDSSVSHGFELRGTISYKLADHIALTGGYQHRQFYRPDPYSSSDWAINETQIEKGFLGGLKFSF